MKSRTRLAGWFLAGVIWMILSAGAQTGTLSSQITVNGETLAPDVVRALTQTYGPIPDGEYWYDPFSGLWGVAGGPSTGQILPGLALGGPLQPDASGGGSGVFVNGRDLHPDEVAFLVRRFGVVLPGRYWMNAALIGGYEGGPAIFDLRAGGGGADGGYNRNTIGGGLMSDGNCSGYLHPGGTTVMTGNC